MLLLISPHPNLKAFVVAVVLIPILEQIVVKTKAKLLRRGWQVDHGTISHGLAVMLR